MLKDQEHGEARSDLGKDPGLLGSVFEMKGMPSMGRYHPATDPHQCYIPVNIAIFTFYCCLDTKKKDK